MVKLSIGCFLILFIFAFGTKIPNDRSTSRQNGTSQLEIEYFPIEYLNATNNQICNDECDKNANCFMSTHERENCVLYSFDFTSSLDYPSKDLSIYLKNGTTILFN